MSKYNRKSANRFSEEEIQKLSEIIVRPEDIDTPLKALDLIEQRIKTYGSITADIVTGKCPEDKIPLEVKAVAAFLNVSHAEALVMYAAMNFALTNRRPDFDDYAKRLDLNLFSSLEIIPFMDKLTERNFMHYDNEGYHAAASMLVNKQVIKAVSRNDASLLPKKRDISSWKSLAKQIRTTFREISRADVGTEDAVNYFRFIRVRSQNFGFWKALDAYEAVDKLTLLFCLREYFFESNRFQIFQPENEVLFPEAPCFDTDEARSFVECLEIYSDGLIEIVEDELIQDNSDSLIIALTEKGKHFFFEDQAVSPASVHQRKDLNLLQPRKIKEVKLFYSGEAERDIFVLEKLMQKESLEHFFSKMEKRNLPSCLSVLLSGGPGTGKTELAMQLARKTGRQILKVDLSAVKDKFVGESEKNVRAIFKTYEEAVRSSKLTPILLLNEADGLLGKRREVNSSVDQMLNTMQTILLEQMESMKGIIIATTNLRSHFDEAFDRRFTFKLEFENPAEKARLEILNSLIPEVDETWRKTLAAGYELSGGQWRNVVYRAFIEEAMGHELTIELLERLAASEAGGSKKKNSRPIGFQHPYRQVA
jgi:hypothetical protein